MPENWRNALGAALHDIVVFVPKAIAFLVIVVVGFFVAKAIAKAFDKVLERVGFDRAVERGGIKTALAHSRYDASDIVARLVYYAVLLFTLQLAFGIWGPNPVSDLIKGVVAWLPKAFVAIVIVVVAAAIARAVKDLVSNALSGVSYGNLVANVASVFILGLGVIAALNQIGVAITVTVPVLVAVLATVGGVIVVGVGGGLIKPMQARWERVLNRAESEAGLVASQSGAYSAGQADATAQFAEPHAAPSAGATAVQEPYTR